MTNQIKMTNLAIQIQKMAKGLNRFSISDVFQIFPDVNEKEIIGGSEKRVTVKVVDLNQCVAFEVAPNDGLIQNTVDSANFNVKGSLANGKKVNIPSILVRPGDVIAIRENFRGSEKCKALVESAQTKTAPKWLEVNKDNMSAKVLTMPAREDIDFPFEEQLIVELYSK